MEHPESEELNLPSNQFDSSFLMNTMQTISLPDGYDNTGIDMPARSLCDALQLQDNIENFSMLTPDHLHSTGSSHEIISPLELSSDMDNTTQTQTNDTSHIITGGVQPIILGNINTANLMALLQRSSHAIPHEVSSSNEKKKNNSVKMSSLLMQPEFSCKQAYPESYTPMLYTTDSDSFKSTYTEDNSLTLSGNGYVSEMDVNAKKQDLVAQKLEVTEKPKLTTSDTFILNHVTSSSEETISGNTISSLSQTAITKTALAKDSSLFPLEKHAFSLMSNISDRVVPLESIPSVSIFNNFDSSTDGKSIFSSTDTVSATENTSIPLLQNILISSGVAAKPCFTVIGSSRIPSSLLLMLKQTKAPVISSSLSTTPLFHLQLGPNPQGKPEDVNKLPEAITDFSDSDFVDYEEKYLHKPGILSRSDTLILGEDNPHHIDSHGELAISEEEPDNIYNQTEDRIVSTSPGNPQELQASQSEENNSGIQTHCSDIIDSISQKEQASTLPFTAIFDSGVDTFGSDTSFSFTDTPCSTQSLSSMLTCISKDHHNLSVLLDGQTHFAPPVSLSKELPEHTSKEAKTNILLGANNISFEPSKLFVNSVTVNTTHFDSSSTISSKETNSVIMADNSFTPCAMSVGDTNCAETTTTASNMMNIPATVIISGHYSSGSSNSLFNIESSSQNSNVSSNQLNIPTVMLTDNQPNENVSSFLEPGPINVTEQNSSEDVALLSESLGNGVADTLCPFPCIKCEKMFRSKKELLQHEKTHQTILKCDLCNACFTRVGNFTRHRKIHNLQSDTLNLYKCEHCGRDFLQRCDLKRHLLIHTKKEPYRCEKCGKGYIRRSDLVVHMRFHNKERAFKCTECDKRFFQSGDLNRHMRRTHHPNAQLTCGHCDRKYACETTLIRHMKASHKDIIVETVHQKLKESQKESATISNLTVLSTSTDDPD